MTIINGSFISGNNITINGRFYGSGSDFQQNTVRGNGEQTHQDRELTDKFTAVDTSGCIGQLDITCQAGKNLAQLDGESNILQALETRVKDGTLFIQGKEGSNLNPTTPVHVTLFMDGSLSGLDLSGGVHCNAQGLQSNSLNIDMSGGAVANLAGSARKLELDLSGGATLKATDLQTSAVEADMSGGASAKVQANGELEFDGSGGASLGYLGSPSVEKDISGGARLYQL